MLADMRGQAMAEENFVAVWADGGVGRIRLNRPQAINALNLDMIETLRRALDDFADDPRVVRVLLDGAGERGLCSGADVRQLRQIVLDGGDPGEFLAAEYTLDHHIATYPKPYAAMMDGITMGGGLGVSAHGSERVVTPRSTLGMPETGIGLFPDVLMSRFLCRMPDEIGTHLALTGMSVGAADAVWLGLADRCEGDPGPAVLPAQAEWIAECYEGGDAVQIVARLENHVNPQARETGALLRSRCPLSVAVTLAALRRAPGLSLDELVAQDLSVGTALAAGPDFAEGVRAQLVDRDKNPHWSHARIEDVTASEVAACFPA